MSKSSRLFQSAAETSPTVEAACEEKFAIVADTIRKYIGDDDELIGDIRHETHKAVCLPHYGSEKSFESERDRMRDRGHKLHEMCCAEEIKQLWGYWDALLLLVENGKISSQEHVKQWLDRLIEKANESIPKPQKKRPANFPPNTIMLHWHHKFGIEMGVTLPAGLFLSGRGGPLVAKSTTKESVNILLTGPFAGAVSLSVTPLHQLIVGKGNPTRGGDAYKHWITHESMMCLETAGMDNLKEEMLQTCMLFEQPGQCKSHKSVQQSGLCSAPNADSSLVRTFVENIFTQVRGFYEMSRSSFYSLDYYRRSDAIPTPQPCPFFLESVLEESKASEADKAQYAMACQKHGIDHPEMAAQWYNLVVKSTPGGVDIEKLVDWLIAMDTSDKSVDLTKMAEYFHQFQNL